MGWSSPKLVPHAHRLEGPPLRACFETGDAWINRVIGAQCHLEKDGVVGTNACGVTSPRIGSKVGNPKPSLKV